MRFNDKGRAEHGRVKPQPHGLRATPSRGFTHHRSAPYPPQVATWRKAHSTYRGLLRGRQLVEELSHEKSDCP